LKCIDDVAALKQDGGPDLIIQGSSTIYPGLLAAGLIDRLMLMTFPVTLGKGKRLFGDGTPTATLKIVDHKVEVRKEVARHKQTFNQRKMIQIEQRRDEQRSGHRCARR
jgi:dihydrofolate reductase